MSGPERQNQRRPPWDRGGDSEPVTFGTWLRRQREIREIPLQEIAETSKISLRYLEALEQDRFEVLPAPVFAKGFLRQYARYLGLDADEVVNSFLAAQQEPEESHEERTLRNARPSAEWASGLVLGLVILALIGLIASMIVLGRDSDRAESLEPPPMAAPPAPVLAEPEPTVATEPEPAAAPLVVTMDFTEDCWVEATVDGERRLSELHVQGESVTLEAQDRVLLTLGNPTGVRIEVNGLEYAGAFTPGFVARDIEIDLDSAARLAGGSGELDG